MTKTVATLGIVYVYCHPLGNGIRFASLPKLGLVGVGRLECLGYQQDPPRDVAHVPFMDRIALKLGWYVFLRPYLVCPG